MAANNDEVEAPLEILDNTGVMFTNDEVWAHPGAKGAKNFVEINSHLVRSRVGKEATCYGKNIILECVTNKIRHLEHDQKLLIFVLRNTQMTQNSLVLRNQLSATAKSGTSLSVCDTLSIYAGIAMLHINHETVWSILTSNGTLQNTFDPTSANTYYVHETLKYYIPEAHTSEVLKTEWSTDHSGFVLIYDKNVATVTNVVKIDANFAQFVETTFAKESSTL